MNTVRRIAKNTLVLLIAQMISMGLGFFYIMYTARYLGAEGFGVLSFALAFTGMFGVFSVMKLNLENLNISIFHNRKITKLTIPCNNCKWWFE